MSEFYRTAGTAYSTNQNNMKWKQCKTVLILEFETEKFTVQNTSIILKIIYIFLQR